MGIAALPELGPDRVCACRPPKLLLSRREAAQQLAISLTTLDTLTASGEIPSVVIGERGRKYLWRELESYVDRLAAREGRAVA